MKHCQGCGRFLPGTYVEHGITWCSPPCLDRFIEANKLRQMHLFRRRTRLKTPQKELDFREASV